MPLDCDHIRNEFSALLDDALNVEDRELIEEHLSDCSDCLRELHGYKQVSEAYRYHHPVKAPADFEDRLRARLTPGARRNAWPRRTWVSLAAAAGVTLVAGLLLWQNTQPEEAAFQLSKLEAESAPMALEAAPLRDDQASPDIAPEMAEDSGLSAFSAEPAPEAPSPAAGTSPEAMGDAPLQEGLDAPGAPKADGLDSPRMNTFRADESPATAVENESPQTVPPAPQAEPEPRALGRASAMNQAAEAAETAGSVEEDPAAAADTSGVTEDAPAPTPKAAAPSARAKDAPDAGPAPARKVSSGTLQWRERTFRLRNGIWQQAGYADETAKNVLIPSTDWNTLLDEHPDLNKLVTGDAPVIVKLGESWYKFRRAEPPAEGTRDQGR